MTKTKKFKEIREQMNEITKRPPTREQLEDLKSTLLEIEQRDKSASQKEVDDFPPTKKIARDPEIGM